MSLNEQFSDATKKVLICVTVTGWRPSMMHRYAWGRNRPISTAFAASLCAILLAIQVYSALPGCTRFNPFGVRFGVPDGCGFLEGTQGTKRTQERCVQTVPPLYGRGHRSGMSLL